MQYDATASGNSVAINSTGAGLLHAGTLTDPGHIFFDAGLGYWLYRSNAKSGLTGFEHPKKPVQWIPRPSLDRGEFDEMTREDYRRYCQLNGQVPPSIRSMTSPHTCSWLLVLVSLRVNAAEMMTMLE